MFITNNRVPISLKEALLLIEKDNNGIYRCEENQNFLKETSLPTPLKIISSIFKAYLFLTGQTFNKYLNKD